MEDITIIDNFLDNQSLKKLQHYFIEEQNKINWFYYKDINYQIRNDGPPIITTPSNIITKKNDGFVILLGRKETPIKDEIKKLIEDIKNAVSKKLSFEIRSTIRVKINLNKPQDLNETDITEGIHVDNHAEHITFIYYLNTNNGKTILYDNDKKTIKQQIDCVENRIIVFNGLIHHVGIPATNNDKCLINFNIIEKKINTKLI